eukprot:630423-Pyramimonas_sp.AAC.1
MHARRHVKGGGFLDTVDQAACHWLKHEVPKSRFAHWMEKLLVPRSKNDDHTIGLDVNLPNILAGVAIVL